MAAEEDDAFHRVGSPPPTPRTHRDSREHERSNKEFIRRLANDYIHFKIYGAESNNTIENIRETLDINSSRVSRNQSTNSDRSSVNDSNNNQVVQSPTSPVSPFSPGDAPQRTDVPFRKASKVLRKVSVELERTNSNFFDNVCENLNLTNNDAHVTFQHVSEEVLCPDTLNWGRVVSLFTFGGKLAEWFWDTHQEEKIEELEEWLAESLASKEDWIERNGGWENFADTFDIEKAKEETKMNWLKPGLLMCVGVSLAALFSLKMQ